MQYFESKFAVLWTLKAYRTKQLLKKIRQDSSVVAIIGMCLNQFQPCFSNITGFYIRYRSEVLLKALCFIKNIHSSHGHATISKWYWGVTCWCASVSVKYWFYTRSRDSSICSKHSTGSCCLPGSIRQRMPTWERIEVMSKWFGPNKL